MNKIFRIVWNQSLQTWVVVSELASRHGKPTTIVGSVKKTSKTLKSFFLNSLSLSVLLALPTAANAYVAFNYTDEDGTVHNVDTGVIGGDSSGTTVRRKAQASDDPKIQPLNYRTPGNMTFATPDDTTLSTAATGSGGSKLYTENTGMTQSGIAIGNFANTISKAGQSRTNGGVASSGIAIGNYATAEGGMSIALGSFTHASDIGAIALGTAARAAAFNSLAVMRQASAAGDMSMAIGTAAYAKGTGGIAMGQSATATGNRSVAIGSANAEIEMVSGGSSGYQVGMTTYTDSTSTKADGDSSVAVGSVARAGGNKSIAIGANARVEKSTTSQQDTNLSNAIAIGSDSISDYIGNIAIGNKASSKSNDRILAGIRGQNGHPGIMSSGSHTENMYGVSEGFGTLSVGDQSSATEGSVALGGGAIANTVSVAVGLQSKANSSGVAVGTTSYASNSSVAVGRQAYSDNLGVAMGTTAAANAISTVAVGSSATANAKGAIAIGGRDTPTNTLNSNGDDSNYSLENATKATGVSSISIGTKASASKANAIAQGTLSNAAGTGSIAIGTEAVAGNTSEQLNTIAIGTKSLANTVGGIALGGEAKSTGNGATAVGSYANALATASSAFGNHANASAEAATAIGRQSLAGRNASALGTAAKATGDSSIAIGAGAQAQGANAISIGTGNVVSGNNSGAIGDPTTISGDGTYSLGNNNGTIAASNSGVFGNDNTFAEGANDSIRVIGNHNTIQTSNVQILGNDITAGVANSAYIGSSSRAAAGNTVGSKNKKKDGSDGNTTTAGDGGTVTNATVGAITYGGFAGAQAHGVVTVGAAGNERRIQNVAAGEISATSTDAINGSQLYATNNVVNNVANSVKNVLGGNANVDNAGNITMSNIGGTNKNTIEEAIKHVNQGWKATVSASTGGEQSGKIEDAIQPGETLTFDAGKNIKLTQSQGKISIATKDDVNLNSVTANTVTTGNTSMNTDGVTVTNNGKTTKVEGGKVTGLEERDTNSVNYGTGENAGRAATESAVKAVDDKATTNATNIAKGTKYAGDVAANTTNEFTRQLGDVTNVKGGVTDKNKLSDNNIGVVSNGTDTLTVKLSKELTGLTSAVFGNTTINNDGVTVTNGNQTTKLESGKVTGLEARDPSSDNYGVGDNANRAATEAAVKSVDDKANQNATNITTNTNDITQLKKGWKVTTTASEGGEVSGTEVKSVLADETVTVDAGKNISITQKGNTISVATKSNVVFDSVTTGNTSMNTDGVTVTNNGKTTKVEGGKVTGLEERNTSSTDYGTGVNAGRAATESAVKSVDDKLAASTFGLKAQDNKEVKKNLNNTIEVVGADSNISTKVADGKLQIELAKQLNLTDSGSVTTGASTLNNSGLTVGGTTVTNGKVAGLDARNPTANKADYGIGDNANRAATEAAVKSVDDKANTNTNDITQLKKGWKLTTAADGGSVTGSVETAVQTDDVVTVKAGKNIAVTQDGRNITIATSMTPDFDKGTVTNSDSTAKGGDVEYVTKGGTQIVNGGDVYNAIHTTNNQYQGDNSDVTVLRNPDQILSVKGGADASKLSDNNIGTVGAADGSITVKLAKELADLTNATFGASDADKTVINKDGVTINKDNGSGVNDPAKTVSLTDNGLNNGGNQITNVASGGDINTPENETNAANIGDLKNVSDNLTTKGFALSDDKDSKVTQELGKQIQLKGTDGITVTADAENKALNIGLGNNLSVGGKDGQPGSIGIKGADGQDAVAINGADGGSIVVGGKDGKPGVAVNGKDGSIGLTGKDGSNGSVTVKQGQPGVNGTDGKPRLIVNDEEVATLNDGIKYAGDIGNAAITLNKVTTVVGGVTDADNLSDDNIGVVALQDGDNAKLTVKLAKNLSNLTSAEFIDVSGNSTEVTGGAITSTNDNGNVALRTATETSFIGGPNDTVKLSNEGLDNGNNQITNVASGLGDTALEDATGDTLTNAANIADVKKARTTVTSSDNSILVGETTEKDGHTNYDLTVDKQKIVEGAQLPVVYTDAEGNKLYKQADGSFNTQADGQGKRVEAADVIASMNSGDGSTSTPTKLANVGSSIADQKGDTYLDKLDAANTANANNAVNVSDLKNTADALTNKGFGLTAQDGNAVTKKLGETVEVVGGAEDAVTTTAKNVRTVVNNGKIEVQVAEAPEFKEVTVTNGKDGADGKSVVVKPDAIVFNGVDGVDGKDGTDGQNGQVSVKVEKGEPGLAGNDGKDGESKTRIVYEKPNGDKETVATLNDGLKFKGNGDKVVEKKLNETLTVKGGLAEDKDVTDANTRVDVDDEGNLVVKMAKELTDLTSAVFGNNPVDNKGVENKPGVNVDGSTGAITTQNAAGNQIVINNPAGQITGVESGLGDTKLENAKGDTLKNVANIGDLQNVSKNLTDTGWKLQTNDGTESTVKLGETVQVVDGANTKVSTVTDANGKHTFHVDVTGLPVAYTDADGKPLVKVGDKFYKASDVTDGVVNQDAPEATPTGTTLVSKDGTATPQTLDNVKSVIETPTEDKDFSTVLNEAVDSKPNSAVNVSDLKNTSDALTAKGFGLTDDSGNKVTQELGKQIQIKGVDGVTVTAKDAEQDGRRLEVSLSGDVRVSGKDGKDGTIGVKGADGRDGTTITKDAIVFNGVDGVNGKDGADGKDGQASIKVEKGAKGLDGNDGKDGESKTRIVYEKPNGEKEEVATLNDGLRFEGDTGETIDKKLNTTLKLSGKASENGGLESDAAVTDKNLRVDSINGQLVIQMAQALRDLTSATFGNPENPTSDNPVTTITNNGMTINNGTPEETVSLTKDGLNNGGNQITNVASGLGDKDISLLENNDPTLTNAANIGDLKNVSDNLTKTGWKLQTNNGNAQTVKLGETVQVVDGANTKVSTITSKDGVHSYHIDVTGLPVVYTDEQGNPLVKVGDTFYKASDLENGLPKEGAQPATPAGTSLVAQDGSATPQTLDNVKSVIAPQNGEDFTKALEKAAESKPNSAVNVSDLHNTANALTENLTQKGFGLTDDNGNPVTQELGEQIQIKGKDGVTVTADANDKSLTVALEGDVRVSGKDGKDGTIGVKGADGRDGTTITKDAIVFNGVDGVNGKDGADGKDGQASIKVEKGAKGLDGNDGKDGESKTRIVYEKPNGEKEEVATLNDGLIFQGNGTDTVAKKLNETLQIKGGLDNNAKATDANTRVDVEDGALVVKMAKDLTDLDSATFGKDGDNTVINKDGITITNSNPTKPNVSLTENGLSNGDNKITNVAEGTDDTDAVNVKQLKEAAAAATTTVESSDGTIDVSRPQPQPEDGHIHYDLKVNSQKVVENAQLPVVYTNKDGDKVYKQADGSFNTKPDGSGTKVEAGDIIASMNSGDGSTTSPTKLANVGTSIGDISPTVDGKAVPADKANFLDQLAEAGKDGSKVANNAVNVSDLHNTADALVNKGFNIAADKGGDDNVRLGETVKFTDPNKNIITTVKDNEIQFALNSEVSIGGKDGKPGSIGVKGADGKDAVAINGADGGSIVVGGKDGVPGKDGAPGIAINGKDGSIGIAGKDGSNAGVTVAQGEKGLAGNDGKDGETKTRIVYTKPDGNTEQVATLNDGIKYQGDVGNAQMTLNNTTQIVGGVTNAEDLTDNNIGVVAKQDGKNAKLTVKLAKDLKGLNSVTTTDAAGNSTTVQGNGVTISGPNAAGNNSTVSLTTNGLNNGGNRITHVADGKDDTDAVNVRQLKGAVGNINNNINKLNKDLRAGIAGATATAGLPQVYMPGKSMVAAAAGTYKGQGAIAVGYSRASDNGKVILKLTGNANTRGDFGGSVGVGYQW
ncbi:YadA-like family protein [Avibacterium sp. 20-126]|uniref:YadA-like family protein n=1 Tax=Avibacterium sp. 20-126 TaxID=2911524 RepID=UPI002187D9CF|nr:YadA-like family protein [Avibacterium sp. 20-126]